MNFMRLTVALLTGLLLLLNVAPPAWADLIGSTFIEGILYDIDPATGAGTNPRSTGISRFVGIASSPDGMLYGVTASATTGNPNSLYKINRFTGAATLIGPTGVSFIGEGDVALDPTTGTLYACCGGPSSSQLDLFTVNLSTGAGTIVGSLGANRDLGQGLAFDNSGQLYALDSTSEELKRIDKTNAATISAVPLSVAIGNRGAMTFDPTTAIFYVVDGGAEGTNMLHTLDPTTGVMTAIGPVPTSSGFAGLTFIPPIPEPSTLLLLAVCGIAAVQRRPPRNTSSHPEHSR